MMTFTELDYIAEKCKVLFAPKEAIPTPHEIDRIIQFYLENNPQDTTLTNEQVNIIIDQYLQAHPPVDQVRTDAEINNLIEIYCNAHPCVCDEVTQPEVEAAFPDGPPLVVTPSINCIADVSIAENNVIGDTVVQLVGDDGGEAAVWALDVPSSVVANINQNGLITANIVYDYETTTSYTLVVSYTNSVGAAVCNIQLHITDVVD